MKKATKILIVAGIAMLAGIIFYSCQKEHTPQPVREQGTMTLKTNFDDIECSTSCLQDGPFEQTSVSPTIQNAQLSNFPGYYRHNKNITIVAWHDATNFYIKTTVSGYSYDQYRDPGQGGQWHLTGPVNSDYPFSSLIITMNGVPSTYTMITPSLTYTQSYPLPAGWAHCDAITYSVSEGTGTLPAASIIHHTYNLSGICTNTNLTFSSEQLCIGIPITLTATVTSAYNFTGGEINIEELEGISYVDLEPPIVAGVTSGNNTVTYTYTPNANDTRIFRAYYDGTGSNGYNSSASQDFIMYANDCGCQESFSYVEQEPGILIFTFIPDVNMIEAKVVFIFPQAGYVTFLDGYDYTSFTRPGGHAQNMQAFLSFEACHTYSWTVQLINCTNNTNTANGWTDFRVEDVSKKTDSFPEYTYNCP